MAGKKSLGNSETLSWSNWSGSVDCRPAHRACPRTEDELVACVKEAKRVRVVGAGHSFMPLCETDETQISLENMEDTLIIGHDRRSVSAPAGWSLKRLTQALWAEGLSLINQGDVNPQTVAGALATGTHGTGKQLGSLSTMALAFRLVLPDGTIVQCSRFEKRELFEAARLSLGLAGVATRVDLSVAPAYHLEEVITCERMRSVREAFLAWAHADRHVEFFLFPYADYAIVKRLRPTSTQAAPRRVSDMDEKAFKALCELCAAAPFLTGVLQRTFSPKSLRSRRIGPAHQIFASQRTVRFEEMEYALPVEAGLAALDAVVHWIRTSRAPIAFPFEVRLVDGDDIWLSPFNRGPAMTISMHQFAPMRWQDLFAHAEAIFRDHGGRPHWGKRHTLAGADVDRMYPQAAAFKAVRRRIDPTGKFLNAHLAALFADEQDRRCAA